MEKVLNNGLILPQSGYEITSKEEMSYEDGGIGFTLDPNAATFVASTLIGCAKYLVKAYYKTAWYLHCKLMCVCGDLAAKITSSLSSVGGVIGLIIGGIVSLIIAANFATFAAGLVDAIFTNRPVRFSWWGVCFTFTTK